MLSKVTNIIPYKIIPLNKNNYTKNIKNNYKAIMNTNNNKGTKINNNKNPKIILQNAFLKSEMEKINKNNNKDNNKNINKKKYRYFSSETQNNENKMNINNINENEKNKLNNVTNNICIIIKTSDNKEPEEEKNVRNFGYYNSFKNILNQSYPMSTGNIHIKNIKSSSAFKNKKINNKIKRYNNSFISNKSSNKKEKGQNSFNKRINLKINLLKQNKKLINMENKKVEPEVNKLYDDIKMDSIKSRYKNKNCSIFSPKNKRNKNIKCNNLLFGSFDKNYTELNNIIYTDASENFIETKGNIISSAIKKSKKNMYRQSIQQKKELLGINLNVKEKNNIKRKLYEEFIDYEKQREEIEKKIIINDEYIKNEEKIKDYKSKKKPIKKVFSDDISVKPNKKYYNANNKSIEKINKNVSNDSTINNDNTISKSDFSYIQTEYNRDESSRFINLPKNNSKKVKKNTNIHFNKNKSNKKTQNKLNYKKSTHNFENINDKNNKLNTNNNSLINSKSCMDIFLEESKIKKNTNIIMHDIIKIMNTNKSKNKNNSPRKTRENVFSPPKNEIIMIQNNEDGKTLRCIKKRCKEKKQNIINEIKPNENIKKESPKKLLDYIINDKEKEKNKEENKKLEINIPGQQIETLRRIKLKIENYKKGQKKHRNLNYKKFIKYNSFSYLNNKRNFRINTLQIRRLHSLKNVNNNEKFLLNFCIS